MPAVIERLLRALCLWWFSELQALVPVGIWKFVPRGREFVGVLQHAEFALFESRGNRELRLLRVGHDAREFCSDFGKALLSLEHRNRRLRLRLGSELGLTKILTLPIVAIHDLDQVIRFEMDRLSPFPANEVQFAHRTLQVNKKERCIVVMVQIVPRFIVARAIAICECLGLQPAHLALAGGPRDADLNLLRFDVMQRSPINWIDYALALLALVLAGSMAVGSAREREAIAARLDHQVVAEKEVAKRNAHIRDQLDFLSSTMGAVIDRQKHGFQFTLLVAELTRLMPDDTYLIELHIDKSAVVMSGYAQSASNLIGMLENTSFFARAQFLSPITLDQRNGRERFQIKATMKQGQTN